MQLTRWGSWPPASDGAKALLLVLTHTQPRAHGNPVHSVCEADPGAQGSHGKFQSKEGTEGRGGLKGQGLHGVGVVVVLATGRTPG